MKNKSRIADIISEIGRETAYEESLHLFPKWEELVGPVAACHSSLERTLNEYILKMNPNLACVKDLHFRFELAVKVAFQMRKPYGLLLPKLQEALVGLNRLRNHLVHPTNLDFQGVNKLYDPIFHYIVHYELDKNIVDGNKDKSYSELTKNVINYFNGHAVGAVSAQQKVMSKLMID